MIKKKVVAASVFFSLVMSIATLLVYAEGPQEMNSWTWEARANAPTSGGYGQAVVGAQGKVYLLRCLYAGRNPEFYVYNPASDTWRPVNVEGSVTGTFRTGTSLAWDGGNIIYALAGARYQDSDRREFWLLHLDRLAWERGPDTPYAQGAGNAITWSPFDRMLYAFVGSREHNGGRSFFVRYSPENRAWETLPSLWEYTEDGASLTATDEYIYALQGEVAELQAENNANFARYHIPSGTWEVLPPIPDPGGVGDGGSLLWLGYMDQSFADFMLALGGGSADETTGDGVFLYSISRQTWASITTLPCPVGYYVGNRLALADGRIFYWQGERRGQPCGGQGFYELVNNSTSNEPAPGDIVIVCVLANAPGRYEIPSEWIGFLNVSQHSVNLRGCQICDEQACWTVPYDVLLNPGETWRVHGSEYNPTSYTRGIALRNSGETVSLFFEDTLIDEWSYPGGSRDGEVLTRPGYFCPW